MSDKMREDFEAYTLKRHSGDIEFWKDKGGLVGLTDSGLYNVTWVQNDFELWEASRAAIEVQRPDDFTDGGSPNARILICHHREIVGRWMKAIETQGLKVKP